MTGRLGKPVRLCSRYLEIEWGGKDVVFSFDRCVVENDVLRFREKELRRAIRARLRRLGSVLQDPSCRQFRVPAERVNEAAGDIVRKLDLQIDRIATRTLSARAVESLLCISRRERLRWAKDGRLPLSGSATFQRGTLITVATFSAEKTLLLLASPSIITEWRKMDRFLP